MLLSGDNLLTDPERPLNEHFCAPLTAAQSDVTQLDRGVIQQEIKKNGKRPNRAHESLVNSIDETFADDHVVSVIQELHFQCPYRDYT